MTVIAACVSGNLKRNKKKSAHGGRCLAVRSFVGNLRLPDCSRFFVLFLPKGLKNFQRFFKQQPRLLRKLPAELKTQPTSCLSDNAFCVSPAINAQENIETHLRPSSELMQPVLMHICLQMSKPQKIH